MTAISAEASLLPTNSSSAMNCISAALSRHVPAPPLLEFEIAGCLTVDLGIEVVVLRPEGVGRVEVLEVRRRATPRRTCRFRDRLAVR